MPHDYNQTVCVDLTTFYTGKVRYDISSLFLHFIIGAQKIYDAYFPFPCLRYLHRSTLYQLKG